MAFSLSAGVEVSEVDVSTSVPSVATNIGAYSGNFRWGPVNEIMNVSNEVDLVRMVGAPDTNTAIDFFSVANFLAYSNNMKVVRAGDLSSLKNAGSNTASQILITNDSNYSQNWANGAIESANAAGPFVAKFPGSMGNSLSYSICEANSAAFSSWTYASLFTNAPSTSQHATIRGGSNDELHMVVIDEDGLFSGTPGAVLEKYSNLSRSALARDDTGKSIYYKTVIENSSKYLRCVSDPARPRPLANISWSAGGYSNSNVWVTFNSDGAVYRQANARVFINATTNAIIDIVVYDGGLYSRPPSMPSVIATNGSIAANLTARLAPEYIETSSNFSNNGGVNWDVKDLVFQERTKTSGDIIFTGIAWKPDGTVYYHIGDSGNTIGQNPVSTPWYAASRLSTREFNANNITNLNYSSTSGRTLTGLYFKPDGTKFYHGDINLDATGRRVYEYTMTEAWNVLTASCGTNHFFSTASQDATGSPREVHFKDDGTRMYVIGTFSSDRVYQYTLSTPWSVNTASFTFSGLLTNTPTTPANMAPTGMHFIKDGTVLLIMDNSTTSDERIYQYNLTEAWNIATLSAPTSSSLLPGFEVAVNPSASGLYVSPNEEDVYIANNADDRIYHYRLSIGDPNYSGNSSKSYFTTGSYSVSLKGGTDATLSDANVITGYSYFNNSDEVDIGLVVTGNHSTEVENSIISSLGEGRQDCIVFVSPQRTDVVDKYGSEASNIITTRNSLNSSSYAFMDSGWKYQYDKYNDIYRWIPLNPDVAGICAKTAYDFDEFFSPGGLNRGSIKNLDRLAYNPKKADRDLLYIDQVNPVVTFSGTGTSLFGDKTLTSKPSVFDRIGARRLFIMMRKSLSLAAKYSLFEINDETTRSQFINIVEPYLRDLQGRKGILEYKVVCDETNNTGEIIDRNEFVGDIYVKTVRSVNFIQLNFVATRTGISFQEVAGRF